MNDSCIYPPNGSPTNHYHHHMKSEKAVSHLVHPQGSGAHLQEFVFDLKNIVHMLITMSGVHCVEKNGLSFPLSFWANTHLSSDNIQSSLRKLSPSPYSQAIIEIAEKPFPCSTIGPQVSSRADKNLKKNPVRPRFPFFPLSKLVRKSFSPR